MAAPMRVAFIGLGKMGTGMARNLLRSGNAVTVFNRTRAKAEALVSDGATAADSAAEAVQEAEAVFTMLADDAAVEETVWGSAGFASSLPPGAVHISSSTISVAFARKLAVRHAEQGHAYVGAPVFGRPDAAENKKLIVVTSGSPELKSRLHPLFEAIGRRTFDVGDEPWAANAVKLGGNFMLISMLETFSEAFTTMAKAGIDRQAFLDVMNELWGSPVYQNYGKSIVDRNYQAGAGFALKLGLKDVRQVLELASDIEAPMPLASLVRDHLLSAVANGQGEMDWSSLELVLARSAGLPT